MRCAVLLLILAGCAQAKSDVTVREVRAIGEVTVSSGTTVFETPFGGISAIDRGPQGEYLLLSDDRATRGPARLYRANVVVTESGVELVMSGVMFLRERNGELFSGPESGAAPDPEGLRYDPVTETVLWSSEGDIARGAPPFIREMALDGGFVGDVMLPRVFTMASGSVGPRHNGTVEGLALNHKGDTVVAAMELPLMQDGPPPTTSEGAVSRIALATRQGKEIAQYAYPVDPIAETSVDNGFAVNGVTEILAVDDHRYLVLERSFSDGVGNVVKLFEIDVRGATDVKRFASLAEAAYTPLGKKEIVNFSDLGLSTVDNLEGMAWGPRLANGARTLLVVSDDNFNDHQVTQVIALEVNPR